MKKIFYKDAMKDGYQAIEEGQPFSLIITGWRVRILKKSLPMYRRYIYERDVRNEKKKLNEIIKFARFAMLTPALWAIIISANSEMTMDCYVEGDSLEITFK